MREIVTLIFLAVFGAAGLWAQAPVKLDNEQVHVIAVTAQPHRPSPLVEHPLNRVMIYLDPGEVTWTSAGGKVEKIQFHAGQVRWSPAGEPYKNENVTDHPIRIVEISLKNTAPAPLPVSKLDPVAVDPQHYKVEFENDQVRVLRIHYGPRENGALHEHILNGVVCYLTDHPNAKAGDVRMAGAATHTEENAFDQPVERIAVELK
jgi:quercetin dioxygenase-like cupin family protein